MPIGNWNVPLNVVVAGDALALLSDAEPFDGFSRRLRSRYTEKSSVYNLGIEGAQTRSYLDLVSAGAFDVAMPKRTDMVVLMLGSEDSADANRDAITPDVYAANLAEIIARFRRYTPNIVVSSPPPVGAGTQGHSDPALVEQYAARAREVADATQSLFVDIRTRLQEGDVILDGDATTLTSLGNQYQFDLLAGLIDERFAPANWYIPIAGWHYCDPGLEFTADQECSCPVTSRHEGDTDVCVPCPAGAFQDATKGSCDCSTIDGGLVYDAAGGRCVCREGLAQSGNVCFACPEDSTVSGGATTCPCAPGKAFNYERMSCECDGARYLDGLECLPCPDGLASSADRLGCVCPGGQAFVRDLGACECPEDQFLSGGACVACGDGSYRASGMQGCARLPEGLSASALGLSIAGAAAGGLLFGAVCGWLAARFAARKRGGYQEVPPKE